MPDGALSGVPPLEGDLYRIPFQGGSLVPAIVERYEALAAAHDPRNVLVLKRLPTGVAELTRALGAELSRVGVPTVQSIAHHARGVLARETDLAVLSYGERVEYLTMVLDNHDWDADYYAGPSDLDSFNRDVGRILLDATWQGGFDLDRRDGSAGGSESHDGDDHLLAELAGVNRHFHDTLAERGLIERASVVSTALDVLAEPEALARVGRAFDAVVAVEFEEYNRLERAYLARLSEGAALVCLAEEDSSIERVRSEPGDVGSVATGLGLAPPTDATARPDAVSDRARVARFLATGDESVLDEVAEAEGCYRIREETFEEQLATVANEIEYLRDREGWRYEAFAVLLKDDGSPIAPARHALQHAGVPVSAATADGLDGDRAVRELYALAEYADGDHASPEAETLLCTRLGIDGESLDRLVDQVRGHRGLEARLGAWIHRTDLKERIAREETEVDARSQFANVATLLDIAAFVDRVDFLESTWYRFVAMLERTMTDYAPSRHPTEVAAEEGGVLVDTVTALKNEQRPAVFLLDVAEGVYPSRHPLTPLFPRAWLARMSAYPAVTDVSLDEVRATFSPSVSAPVDPLRAYYRQVDRRTLAIGARAAAERLYFCSHRTEPDTGRRHHPSRFLDALTDRVGLPCVGGPGHERDLHTAGGVSRRVLDQPWERLEAIRAAASTGDADVELADTERLFGAIQALLADEAVDDRFVEAVHRQVAMARGEVGER